MNTLVNYLAQHEAKSGQVHDADIVVNFGKQIADMAESLKEVVS